MKNGTAYAAKLRKLFGKLRQGAARPELPSSEDPLTCLVWGVLGSSKGAQYGRTSLSNLLSVMVDWNEIRVSNAAELQRAVGDDRTDGVQCQNLLDALRTIYQRENSLSLDKLITIGRREAKAYLEGLLGVNEHATACVMLWGLGGHAVPVPDDLMKALRDHDLIDDSANRAEVQGFLERHVGAADAKEFCIVFENTRSDWKKALGVKSQKPRGKKASR